LDERGPELEALGDASRERIRQMSESTDIEPLDELDVDLARRDRSQNIALKDRYARRLLGLLTVQLILSNGIFALYAGLGWDWKVPDGVMLGWLGTTVVELIGVVLVVHHLFPARDRWTSAR
jgi:hypothetical protein